MKQARWSRAYLGLVRCSSLSASARLLLVVLRSYCGRERSWCFPSIDRLGRDLGCSRRSIMRLLAELEKAKWLRRTIRRRNNGARSSTRYDLLDERKSLVQEAFQSLPPSAKFGTLQEMPDLEEEKYGLFTNEKQPMKKRKIVPFAR